MKEYKLNKVKTKVSKDEQSFQTFSELESYSAGKMTDIGSALFFFDHEVIWAKWDGNSFRFQSDKNSCDISNLQMMRLFNEGEELFIRRTESDKWLCRLRRDGSGEEKNVMDAHQYLLGESQGKSDFTELKESAGSAGFVPIGISPGKRAFLHTRNYIGFAGEMLANFEDSRLISIEEVS